MPHTELFPFLRLFDGRYLDPRFHVWWLEALFWILALLLAIPLLKCGRTCARLEAAWRRASRHRVLSMLVPGLLVIVLRLALLPLIPVPAPEIHDEFSYLLGAETFAAGRLTNPTPDAWQHFETFHVNLRPSYHSMYPPAQFLFPALGILLAKNAWIGVLLGVAVMCSAITWMLQGWAPAHWALLGGLWAALRFGIFSYWVNSYWGGAMAATAGALVLGAVARILRSCRQGTPTSQIQASTPMSQRRAHRGPQACRGPRKATPLQRSIYATSSRVKDGVLLALGLVLLANSRPLEGLLFSLPLLGYLVVRIVRCDPGLRGKLLSRIALPAGLLLLAGAAWMAYYDSRTVGNPWTMPYMVNHAEYHVSKPFLGQARNPIPAYRHDSMRRFYVIHELPDYLDSQSFWGVRQIVARNAAIVYVFFFCPVGLLMLAGWLRLLRPASTRATTARVGVSGLAQSMIAVSAVAAVVPSLAGLWPPHGHYAAPATGAFIFVGLVGLRLLRMAKVRGARIGLALSRAVVILLAIALLAAASAKIMDPFELNAAAKNSPLPLRIERERIESQLSRSEGQHLVIVFYGPKDIPGEEWIANKPDPRSAKIIWARDMGTAKNEELLRAYPGRHVWLANRSAPCGQLIRSSATALLRLEEQNHPGASGTSAYSPNSGRERAAAN